MNNVSNRNAYAPNFNGFINFSKIKSAGGTFENLALNTRNIVKTLAQESEETAGRWVKGAVIETADGKNYLIPKAGADGTPNFYENLLKALGEAETKGVSTLDVNI